MEPVSEEQIKNFVAQLQDDLVTAEKFLAMWQRRNQLVRPADHGQLPLKGNGMNGSDYGSIASQVRSAITKCPDPFTMKNIQSALLQDGKKIEKPVLAGCIKRLLVSKNPTFRVMKKGVGQKPAKYAKL